MHLWTIEGAASRLAEDTTPTAGADKSVPGPRQAPSDSVKGGTSGEWRTPVASSMRRSGQPSRPRARICCLLSSVAIEVGAFYPIVG